MWPVPRQTSPRRERWPQRDECDKLLTEMNLRARTQLLRAPSVPCDVIGLTFDEVPDPVAVKAKMPPPLTPLIDGNIAFRQHDQGHVDAPNWPTFIEFVSRYFQSPGDR